MPDSDDNFRIDFSIDQVSTDEETGIVGFRLRPNPDRYDWIEHEGERALFDRMDRTVIPESVLADAMKQTGALPVWYRPPKIENALEYVQSRIPEIETSAKGLEATPTLADPSSDLLEKLAGNELEFSVISVDLVGSTKLSGELEKSEYLTIVKTLTSELAQIITLFNGHVLKYTGDGAIFYIPGPSFNQQNDLAIDCALTMRALVYRGLNPVLDSLGFRSIDVRIGIDSGKAAVQILGSSTTKSHADLIGEVVSLACKIESTATPGGINVGKIAARAMHTNWRKCLREVKPPTGWPYKDDQGNPYAVYCVSTDPVGKATLESK